MKPANFKLADVQLRWQDNPGFGYQVRFLANQYAVEKRPSNYDSERAKTYMGKLIKLFSAQCVPKTTDLLLQRGGAGAGKRQEACHASSPASLKVLIKASVKLSTKLLSGSGM